MLKIHGLISTVWHKLLRGDDNDNVSVITMTATW